MKKYLGAYIVIVATYLIYLVLRIYNGGAFDWFGDLSMPFPLLVLYWSIKSHEKRTQKTQAQESLAQAEDLFNSLLKRAFNGELV